MLHTAMAIGLAHAASLVWRMGPCVIEERDGAFWARYGSGEELCLGITPEGIDLSRADDRIAAMVIARDYIQWLIYGKAGRPPLPWEWLHPGDADVGNRRRRLYNEAVDRIKQIYRDAGFELDDLEDFSLED